MTKIINLFGNKEEKKGKPIEFIKFVDESSGETATSNHVKPKDWDNVSLLCKSGDGFDMMFAWDSDDPDTGCVYLGHWNDGIVD